jgi:hypothetical protein
LHAVLGAFQVALIAERAALVLVVGNVVAAAAPGVEQPAALARVAVEQLGGRSEALRAFFDRFLGARDEIAPVAAATGARRRRADLAGRQWARRAQRSSAFIWKIGVCAS